MKDSRFLFKSSIVLFPFRKWSIGKRGSEKSKDTVPVEVNSDSKMVTGSLSSGKAIELFSNLKVFDSNSNLI